MRQWVEHHPHWPRLTRSIAGKWLDEGLTERCITRDLEWGVPVPREGFDHKVFYVWFDAPIEYIGAALEWADADPDGRDYQRWWKDSGVTYTQFMAKDNVPFHTVFFPAMVLGTGEPWNLPHQVKSFHWLTYYGGKFSTSQHRGIFLDDALSLFDADMWRYYLLANAPENDDSSFTWALFAGVVNKDLVGVFGNFVNRTLKLTASQFGPRIPLGGTPGALERQFQADCQAAVDRYRASFSHLEYRKAVRALRDLWSLGNVYLDRQAPWTVAATDRAQAAMVLRTAISAMAVFAVAAAPVIPFAAARVLKALGLDEQRTLDDWPVINLAAPMGGRPFALQDPLFQRIAPGEIEELETRYRGQESL